MARQIFARCELAPRSKRPTRCEMLITTDAVGAPIVITVPPLPPSTIVELAPAP